MGRLILTGVWRAEGLPHFLPEEQMEQESASAHVGRKGRIRERRLGDLRLLLEWTEKQVIRDCKSLDR